MIRLIGLLGAKGCGKDTLAKFLIAQLGFVRASFATVLYLEVARAYDVTIAFFENRETKETDLPELRLANCADKNFVEIALAVLSAKRSASRDELLQQPRSPRWVMQLWGTEYRRRSAYGWDSYWIDQVENLVRAAPATRFVVTDVRFLNEIDFIRRFDGSLVRVRRLELERREALARLEGKGTALHPSELEVSQYAVDLEVFNREGDPASLLEGVPTLLPELTRAA